jgi:hypothetical protein
MVSAASNAPATRALTCDSPNLGRGAIGVSVVEIAIIVTKFALFLPDPVSIIWTTNWFINKLFVLACFCLMLPYFTMYLRLRCKRDLAASPS